MKKNKNIFESIRCALNGIIIGFKEEKNLVTYILIAVIFFFFNIFLKSTSIEFVIFFILCFIVFSIEYINTAIERVVDKFIIKKDENAKFIKDVSAASVLIVGICFFIVEGIILIPKLITMWGRLWF